MRKLLKKISSLLCMGAVGLLSLGLTGCDTSELQRLHLHNFVDYVYDENATCYSDGTETAVCSFEGCEVTNTRTAEGTKTEHNFVDYVSNLDADRSKDGTKTAVCINEGCSATDTIVDVGTKIVSLLPALSINTKDAQSIDSKENYLSCSVSVSNTDYEYVLNDEVAKIKGRGNSTWDYPPKKPYKLKFNSKIDLFGNGEAKTWVLLANYYDRTLIRNYLALSVAGMFETQNMCTETHFVDLFINGEYNGVYLVCEQVEVAKNRLEIDEDLTDVNTGYLIEMDVRASGEGELDKDYFVVEGTNYAIKSPDTEEDGFDSRFVNYIKDYVANAFDEICQEDNWNEIQNWIDIQSFAECYIIQEIFHNADVGISSFYMYKDKDGLLSAGPVWDFDLSSNNYYYVHDSFNIDFFNPEKIYAGVENIWFSSLLNHSEFRQLVSDLLSEKSSKILKLIDNNIDKALSMKDSFAFEFTLWYGSETEWLEKIYELKDWLHSSVNFLNAYFEA